MRRLSAMNNALDELLDEREATENELLEINEKIEALEARIGELELEDMHRSYERDCR